MDNHAVDSHRPAYSYGCPMWRGLLILEPEKLLKYAFSTAQDLSEKEEKKGNPSEKWKGKQELDLPLLPLKSVQTWAAAVLHRQQTALRHYPWPPHTF